MKRFGIGGFRSESVYALQAEIRRECKELIDIERCEQREGLIQNNIRRLMESVRSASSKRIRCLRLLDLRPCDQDSVDLNFKFHSSNLHDHLQIPKYIRQINCFRISFGGEQNQFQLEDRNEKEESNNQCHDAEDSGEPFSADCKAHSGEEIRFGWESSNPTLVSIPSSNTSATTYNRSNDNSTIEEISLSSHREHHFNGRVLKQSCPWTIEMPRRRTRRKYILQLRIASHRPQVEDDVYEEEKQNSKYTTTSSKSKNEALKHLMLNDENILQSQFDFVQNTKDLRVYEVVVLVECKMITLSMDNDDKIVLISASLYGPFGNIARSSCESSSSLHHTALSLGQSLCHHVLSNCADKELNASLFFMGVKEYLKSSPLPFSSLNHSSFKSPFRYVGQWLSSAASDARLSQETRKNAIHVLVEMTVIFDHIDLELLVASTLCDLTLTEKMSLNAETINLLRNRHIQEDEDDDDEDEEEDTDKILSCLHIILKSLHRRCVQNKIKVSSSVMIEMAKFGLSVICRCVHKNLSIASKSLRFVCFILQELDYSVFAANETLTQNLFRIVPEAAVRHVIIRTS